MQLHTAEDRVVFCVLDFWRGRHEWQRRALFGGLFLTPAKVFASNSIPRMFDRCARRCGLACAVTAGRFSANYCSHRLLLFASPFLILIALFSHSFCNFLGVVSGLREGQHSMTCGQESTHGKRTTIILFLRTYVEEHVNRKRYVYFLL